MPLVETAAGRQAGEGDSQRAVTADTALRLVRYFGISEGFWMGLRADCGLEEARERLGEPTEGKSKSS